LVQAASAGATLRAHRSGVILIDLQQEAEKCWVLKDELAHI